jgi:beta-lactamase regulating signal transducer with metallopeptidase domain
MNPLFESLSNLIQNSHFAAWFFDALLKSFVVLALAGGICALARRASAATKHLIWFLAVASLPCLPFLTFMLPSWEKPLWSVSTGFDSGNQASLALEFSPGVKSEAAAPNMPAAPGAAKISGGGSRTIAARFSANWLVVGFVAWVAGVALVLISVIVGQLRLRKLSRTAQIQQSVDWALLLDEARETLRLRRAVTLLQSADNMMPLTWGWWQPVVLLPADAENWPVERRRIVLLHELAHVKRRDCLTQIAASMVCAFYWFNPLVWLAARQMCVERERACDDLVLNGGCKASDYAGHLVEIARSFRRVPQVAAIAMARPSGLEQRVAAIVDASRTRCLRPVTLLAVLAVVGGVLFCVSGCKTTIASRSKTEFNPLREQQIARLKEFSALKEKQSRTLAAAAGEKISPEYQRFFDAATTGDWQTVTNLFESFKQRHPQYSHPHQHADVSLRTSFWGPVLEICLAYANVVLCEPKYTQMAADGIINSIPPGSIYFGGTDPGRGLPTAFSKSHADADPFYTLTQNALADGTYLEYLRKTYGEEKALLNQLAEACQADPQLQDLNSKWPAAVQKLESLEISEDDPQWKAADKTVIDLWQKRDERVKAILTDIQARADTQKSAGSNQTGTKTIYIPTGEDSQKCFQDYTQDAIQRLHNHQLKPGEDVKEENGRIQVSGQAAVMAINGLLVKIILDKNPDREFYLEESFPLDWMYPYLEPHGLIFKINRQPLAELSDATVKQDREYWQPRMNQMIGGWLNEDTPVKMVTKFAEKIYLRHDLGGFTGDPRFVQNDWAPKMFSKFRSAIAGVYAWRAEHSDTAGEKQRLARAADLAFRQAVALCPFSPEAVYRYATFLTQQHREGDAKRVMALLEEFKFMNAGLSVPPAKASFFQIRLVVDAPADDAEKMIVLSTNQANGQVRHQEHYVQKPVLLDQTALQSAKLIKGPQGDQQIEITFTSAGRKQFAEVTREHLHQRLAIIVEGKLLEAPVIQSEISGGKCQITGSFSEAEAKALAAEINAAAGK